MKKIFILSVILFFIGFLFSGFLGMYLKKEEYKADVFIIEHQSSSRRGAVDWCSVGGHLKSNGQKAGMQCSRFREFFPELDIGALPFGKSNPNNTTSYKVSIFVTPQGGLNIYNEKEKRFEPGVTILPIYSFQTFLMLPLILLLLYQLLNWLVRRTGLLFLLSLFAAGHQGVFAQAEQGDTLVSFNVTTIIPRAYTVELVRYDSLVLKKTPFDTMKYQLAFAEECLLCEISATDEPTFQYCSASKKLNKNLLHYQSIAAMEEDELFFEPTLKFIQYGDGDTTAYIKVLIVDNIKQRKIRSLRKIDRIDDRWQLSADQIDGETGMMISSLKDEVLVDIFLRRLDSKSDLFDLQEKSFPNGVLNLRSMAKAYGQWFVKGKEQTELIQKYTENLIQ